MAVPYTSNITYAFIFVIALLFGLLVYGLSFNFVTTGGLVITLSIGYPTLYGYIYRRLFRRTILDNIQFYSICFLLVLCFVISNYDQLLALSIGVLLGVVVVIFSVYLVVANNKFIASVLPKPKYQKIHQQNFDNEPTDIVHLNVNRSSGSEDSSTSDSNNYQNTENTFPK